MSVIATSDIKAATTVTPAKRSSRLAPILFIAGAFGAYFFWPQAWIAWNNPAPETLTLEDYLTHGSQHQWLILKDCYVASSGKVETDYIRNGRNEGRSYTYYALSTGPDDQRKTKIFIRPRNYASGENQIVLGREGDTPAQSAERAIASHPGDLQEITGTLATRLDFGSDIQKILRGHGAADCVLLLHNDRPLSTGAAAAALFVPLVLAGLAIVLWRRAR